MDRAQWRRLLVGDFSVKRLTRSILLVYVSFAVIIFFAADHMMFHPEISTGNKLSNAIMLATVDGEMISAIYRPATSSEYTILFSHGNAEALADLEYFFARLNKLGFSVFAYAYRGYGASEGEPTEKNTYEDIDAAFDYLTRQLNIPGNRIIAYGRSIGGGPSTDLASREAIAGLILESSFVSAFRVRTRIPILPLVKLFFCLRHLAHQSLDEAQLYWRTNHGPLIRGVAPGMRMQRYLQVHYYADEAEQQLSAPRGTQAAPYTGHAEAWFDRADLAAMANVPEAIRAMELAIEDETKFIDFPRSAMWIGKERVFIDRR